MAYTQAPLQLVHVQYGTKALVQIFLWGKAMPGSHVSHSLVLNSHKYQLESILNTKQAKIKQKNPFLPMFGIIPNRAGTLPNVNRIPTVLGHTNLQLARV